jgi:hypothetical protein
MKIPDEIKEKALLIYESVLPEEFPEDTWILLSGEFDLNLWSEYGENHATIYPVIRDVYGYYSAATRIFWRIK